MWSWQDWSESAETTLDLAYEANDLGLIPLECQGRLRPTNRTCKTKLFNAPQKRRQGGLPYQRVYCLLCGWEDWRKVGLKRKKMDEKNQGNQRGDFSDRSKDQEGKDRSFFQANGLEHFAFSPKTVISWGVLSGLVGLFVASISVYQSFGSNVDERISNHRELNRKLDKYEWEIQSINRTLDEHENQIKDIEQYFKPKGKR